MVRLNQVLIGLAVVLFGVALATGCLGCDPSGSTEPVTEAPSAPDDKQVIGDPSLPVSTPVGTDPTKTPVDDPPDNPPNTEPDPISNPIEEHNTQCTNVTPGDGIWVHEISKMSLEVTCQPMDGMCAVSFNGAGLFGGTFLTTGLPIDETRTDDETGDVYTFQFEILDGGTRAVQRLIINNVVNGESFFRR